VVCYSVATDFLGIKGIGVSICNQIPLGCNCLFCSTEKRNEEMGCKDLFLKLAFGKKYLNFHIIGSGLENVDLRRKKLIINQSYMSAIIV